MHSGSDEAATGSIRPSTEPKSTVQLECLFQAVRCSSLGGITAAIVLKQHYIRVFEGSCCSNWSLVMGYHCKNLTVQHKSIGTWI